MTRRQLIIIGGLMGVILVGALGWWLASPLFLNQQVDEAFPFELPNETEIAAMSQDEKVALEAEFMSAIPDEDSLEALSEEDRAIVEEMVQEAAAAIMADKSMEEPMPEAATEWLVAARGVFMDADSFHMGSGSATILQQGERSVLRFEEFEVTNGPDLHVILSKNPTPANRKDIGGDYIDLGQLKGNQGNQNYNIPENVELSQYQSVVIYCVPFHVVFATATLN
jgi:hypothetical protein